MLPANGLDPHLQIAVRHAHQVLQLRPAPLLCQCHPNAVIFPRSEIGERIALTNHARPQLIRLLWRATGTL
jgi:hypothetical protein